MDRRGNNSLLERIVGSGGAVVVRGPAGSGKTSAVLDVYEHFQDGFGRSGCMLVAPNAAAASALRRAVVARSVGQVAIALRAATFSALARGVLAAAGDGAESLSSFQRRLLLGQVVADLGKAGKLAAIGAVADTPGLVVALDRAIGELKRAAVEPEALARAVGRGSGKHGDLVEVYRRYQAALHERGASDEEGRAWLARDHLRAAAKEGRALPGLDGVRAMAVDGFTDFTATQLEILAVLAGKLELLVVTLPYGLRPAAANGLPMEAHGVGGEACDGGADTRERMWHWTGRTLGALRERLGGLREIDLTAKGAEDAKGGAVKGVGSLWSAVFVPDAKVELPDGFNVVGAAGVDAEVGAAARRIKRLLADGAPAGSIAVLARSLEEYREPIRRVFAACGVPVPAWGLPLTEAPAVRFLLRAAALGPEYAWRDVLAVMKSSYFSPGALGEYGAETVLAAEKLVREGNVVGGREAYAEAGKRLIARAEFEEEEREDGNGGEAGVRCPPASGVAEAEIRRACEMLERLFEACAGAQEGDLLKLAETLKLADVVRALGEPKLVARDLRALAALAAHLRGLGDARCDLAAVCRALAAETCPAERGEDLVDVLDVLDARAMSYDHVLLLGASERQFPPRMGEPAFIGEAERVAWRKAGVRLDARSDLTAREMLLFYLAVTRARRTLTISYLETGALGGSGAPGPFLLSLIDAVGGMDALGGSLTKVPPGRFVPAAGEEPVAVDEAFNAAFAGFFGREVEAPAGLLEWAAEANAAKLGRAAMGLLAFHRRWRRGECDEFDGRIAEPGLVASLGRRFGREAVFSAAKFDAYGQCPWQFFAKYVLELREAVQPERRLEPASRGSFVHAVLCRLMRGLAGPVEQAGPPGVRLWEIDEGELGAALERAIGEEAAAVEARRPAYPLLWRIQRDQMQRELREYLASARQRAELLRAEALHFELAFGPQEWQWRRGSDAASCDEPASVATPAGVVRVCGRIDRVDRVSGVPEAGLMVVDYKTGRLPSRADVLGGRNVQIPLYAAAAAAMLGEACLGGAFHGVGGGAPERLFAAIDRAHGKPGYKADGKYGEELAAVLAKVGGVVTGMRGGHFELLPTGRCPAWCHLRRICQRSPVRGERKAAGSRQQAAGGEG